MVYKTYACTFTHHYNASNNDTVVILSIHLNKEHFQTIFMYSTLKCVHNHVELLIKA